MEKPVKNSIAYVIYNRDRSLFVIVQRPFDDDDLPGYWGLPAGSLKEKESFEDAVVRSGREKLGVELKVNELINEGELERDKYVLHMREYEARIIKGVIKVPQEIKGVTQYKTCRWETAEDLIPASKKGYLCCKLYLESIKK